MKIESEDLEKICDIVNRHLVIRILERVLENYMLIIKMNGGLGNQLQQYALYEKLKSLGKNVKLDISWFSKDVGMATKRELELNYFPKVSYDTCTEEELGKVGNRGFGRKVLEKLHVLERNLYVEHQMYDEKIFLMDNKVLEGYWACEAYYEDILPELRNKLTFPKSGKPENTKMEERMRSCNSVSIHLRRGDYLQPENQELFGGICTEEYYEQALLYIKEHVKDAKIFIFSDDPVYAREKYSSEEYTIVDINHGKDSFFDIHLMSCCKHHICANSTFSFWGARLNPSGDKIMVRPLKQKNCDWYVPEEMKRLWKHWVLIDEEGKIV